MSLLDRYKAVIFDTDGVITKTADLHAKAWKELFDNYLKKHTDPFVPFDAASDYLRYVDGKPRLDGIKSFFESRGIELDEETLLKMGDLKNTYFLDQLKKGGVEVYETTVSLIKQLRQKGIKVGVISASKNCEFLLKEAGILELFDAKVDGLDSVKLKIKGKPEPDIFLEAAKRLGVTPEESVVVEDALSGVEAGKNGGFALVIGVNRGGHAEALKEHGADVVVDDLGEINGSP